MRTRQSRRQGGQASLEWLAALLLAGVLVVATVVTIQNTHVDRAAAAAVCRVLAALPGGSGGACGSGPGGGAPADAPKADPRDDDPYDDPWYCDLFGAGCYSPSPDGGDPQREDAPQPWYCDAIGLGCHDAADPDQVAVPDGLDHDSDLVQQLLSTARGRTTLQWLSDNHIPIVMSSSTMGAYWDGSALVIGDGYDQPAVIVHETNHAMAVVNGTSANPATQNRQDYVTTEINEEVDGTVKGIQAAKELRAAGHATPEQPLERWFDQAYGAAKDGGASDTDALDAATKAVAQQFFDGNVKTSTTDEPYIDYYGDDWDSVH